MTTNGRGHGQTPAELGERCAREDEAFRKAFLPKLKDPDVNRAAIQAVKGIAALESFGMKVSDWSATGSRIAEIEVQDTVRGEKGRIRIDG